MNYKSICVMGLGYIGLPTSALLANRGYQVLGVDINQNTIDTINNGKPHIVEPDLDTIVSKVVNSGLLTVRKSPTFADTYIICVPTPFRENNGNPKPDISYILSAAGDIAPFLREGNIVILESTSPVGTTEKIKDLFEQMGVDTSKLYIAYCPERVLPGKIMEELIHNDRVIGGINEKSTKIIGDFYRSFVKGNILETNAKTAELCKLVENSYRDVNIAFANELSMICDRLDIKVNNLINLANCHPRVNILKPSVGVGGHCIAVDPWFVISSSPNEARLMYTARKVNEAKTKWIIQKIINQVKKFQQNTGKNPKVACLGLTYKPDIDDLRESPALKIALHLIDIGIDVVAVEPNIENHNTINLISLNEVKDSADLTFILVRHKEFRNYLKEKNNAIILE